MPRDLTNEDVQRIEKIGVIPNRLKHRNPTLHFCKEWDFMLIDDSDPEWEACTESNFGGST